MIRAQLIIIMVVLTFTSACDRCGAGLSAPAFVRVDLLNPHDEPVRAICHEPPFAEKDTESEKGRDLSGAAQRMTWSRAVTQPGWSEVKALFPHHCTVLTLSQLALMPVTLQAGTAARNPGCGETFTTWYMCGRSGQADSGD